MDIQVLRMNIVNVKREQVRELTSDLKKWRIRHYPFRRQGDIVCVTIYPTPKMSWLVLKYS
jgi:hypothetical protein